MLQVKVWKLLSNFCMTTKTYCYVRHTVIDFSKKVSYF